MLAFNMSLYDHIAFVNDNNIFKSCNLRIKRIISKDFLRGVSLIKENLELQTFFEIQISFVFMCYCLLYILLLFW